MLTDITLGNRSNLTDAKDPGGRLGPYSEKGEPDLRNLGLYLVPCHDDDVIMLVTDGIHDNLDPQHLGILPKELDLEYETWQEAEKADAQLTEMVKNDFRLQLIKYLVPNMSVYGLTEGLGEYCQCTTQTSRDFMESNTFQKLPDDYVQYPGKMDHTTIIAFRAHGLAEPLGCMAKRGEASSTVVPSLRKGHCIGDAEQPRKLVCYSTDREHLAELVVDPTDLVIHLIAKLKAALGDVIAGRPYRLRKGEEGWRVKPKPIVKQQFELRVLDIFTEASDFVVVQFGPTPRSKRDITGSS
jgi:hypothetical protein